MIHTELYKSFGSLLIFISCFQRARLYCFFKVDIRNNFPGFVHTLVEIELSIIKAVWGRPN